MGKVLKRKGGGKKRGGGGEKKEEKKKGIWDGIGQKFKETWALARDGAKDFFSRHGKGIVGNLISGAQKAATDMVGETADWMKTHGSEALKKQLGFRRGRKGRRRRRSRRLRRSKRLRRKGHRYGRRRR